MLIGNEDMGIGIGMDIAETVPGIQVKANSHCSYSGGGTYTLKHSAADPCRIPDGDTIVLTGGRPASGSRHDNYVTRYEESNTMDVH